MGVPLRRDGIKEAFAERLRRLPDDGRLHLLLPSGIGDLYWVWRKWTSVAKRRPLKLWFPDGEQHRAGQLCDLLGIEEYGYLPGLTTAWVWEQPGDPPIPDGPGVLAVQANRHLEAGRPLAGWYPALPLATQRLRLSRCSTPTRPYALFFAGAKDYMEGNLDPQWWARMARALAERVGGARFCAAGRDAHLLAEIRRFAPADPDLPDLVDKHLGEVLAAAKAARVVIGVAGGVTITAIAAGCPTLIAYPRWLERMPGTWEPETARWSWCFVDQLCSRVLDRTAFLE